MRKRLILFIIFLFFIGVVVYALFTFIGVNPSEEGEPLVKIEFVDEFFGIGGGQRDPGQDGPVFGETPDFQETPDPEQQAQLELFKISSSPIAGFTIFEQERFIEVPDEEPPTVVGENETESPQEGASENKEESEGETEETAELIESEQPEPPETELVPAVRYANIANGNVYQTFIDEIDERRISATLIPQLREAYFAEGGESAIMRYLGSDGTTINTFVGKLPEIVLGGDTSPGALDGTFLPENITSVSIAPNTSLILYLYDSQDYVTLNITDAFGDSGKQVFDSSFTEWLTQWPNESLVTLTTKPAASVPGYMYALDLTSNEFWKVISGVNGLTTLTGPEKDVVLYNDRSLTLYLYEIASGEVTNLNIKTLPEKCIWSKTGTVLYCAVPKFLETESYPDAWYKGKVSFSDQIWEIDLFNSTERAILDPIQVPQGEEIDAVSLMLDEDEQYLVFKNKKDSFLWGLKLD